MEYSDRSLQLIATIKKNYLCVIVIVFHDLLNSFLLICSFICKQWVNEKALQFKENI